jgi:hypothetical protein
VRAEEKDHTTSREELGLFADRISRLAVASPVVGRETSALQSIGYCAHDLVALFFVVQEERVDRSLTTVHGDLDLELPARDDAITRAA